MLINPSDRPQLRGATDAADAASRQALIDGLDVADLGLLDADTQPGELDALLQAAPTPAVGAQLLQDVVLDHAVGHRRSAPAGNVQALPLPRPREPAVRLFDRNLEEHRRTFEAVAALRGAVERTGLTLADCLRAGHKLLFCGNGGSAADSQHLAAELTGRFLRDRAPLAAIALSTDTSALTCIGNDYGFEQVFERQVQALGRPGDVLVAISTSGHSPNILRAVRAARAAGLVTIALAGRDGGELARICDDAVVVPHAATARVQEAHIFIGHTWCGLIEEHLGLAG